MAGSSDLDATLADVARQYDATRPIWRARRSRPDPKQIRRLGQELARLEPMVEAYRALLATREELAGARQLRDSGDSTTTCARWPARRSHASRPRRST